MAQQIKDSFLDLERHRQILEENIEKLRKSLQHWQTWEAEYEGLKEEILAVQPAPSTTQLVRIGLEYEATLLDRNEIEDILGLKTGMARNADQITSLLSRRIDYVQQNVRTVQKQLETAENKLVAATIISEPEVRNEEGLPLTEIIEELDEDGNEISSRVQTPGSAKPQLLEVLKKAGVKDLPAGGPSIPKDLPSPSASNPQTAPAADIKPHERVIELGDEAEEPATSERPTKKGVSFTEDTKPGPETQKSKTAQRIEEIMNIAKGQNEPITDPILPADESPEDSAMRQQMLQYGMSEISNVVAELDLEEGDSFSDEDYEDEDDYASSDDEDRFGRSTGKVVDDDLRAQMREIEERLGLRMMENVGPAGQVEEEEGDEKYGMVREGIGRISVKQEEDSGPSEAAEASEPKSALKKDSTSGKKAVKFAEELDISPAPEATVPKPAEDVGPKIAPVADIVERKAPSVPAVTDLPAPTKKQSRFKSSRAVSAAAPVANGPLASAPLPLFPAKPAAPKPFSTPIAFAPASNPRPVPTGPANSTLASTVVEREVEPQDVAEPDEFDPAILNQQVATEYHRLRNRMIQRQGGFLQQEESGIIPLTEEEGGPKKMSRFKAARLARN
jgi:unconventional prefoldin RPB5 interactor 1